jgi:hypothetical protein
MVDTAFTISSLQSSRTQGTPEDLGISGACHGDLVVWLPLTWHLTKPVPTLGSHADKKRPSCPCLLLAFQALWLHQTGRRGV